MSEFEIEYEDVLQNMEFVIMEIHRNEIPLVDYDVMEAIEALIKHYRKMEQGGSPVAPTLSDRAQHVFSSVRNVCEWRVLGKDPSGRLEGMPVDSKLITVTEIIACLKRILKSVKRWNKQYGRQGYLSFVGRYLK